MDFLLYVIAFFHRKALILMSSRPEAGVVSEEELVEKVYKTVYKELMKPK